MHERATSGARGWLLLAAAACAAAAAAWIMQRTPPAPGAPPADVRVPDVGARAPGRLSDPERAPAGNAATLPSTSTDGATSPPTAFGVVRLSAVDDADLRPLSGFAWSAARTVPGMPAGGFAPGVEAVLRVPLGRPAAVHVHAGGYADSLPVDVSLRDGATSRAVTVRLLAAAPGEPEVALTLVDDRGLPVVRARVTCLAQPPADERAGGNAWQVRFARVSFAADGVHRFPGLAPGRYRFRVVALSEGGSPRLLLPVEHRLTLADGKSAEGRVQLAEPAGTVLVSVRDRADGAPLGPGLEIRVDGPGGGTVAAGWIACDGDPTEVAAGELPVAGRCELAEPLAPGRYAIHVRGGGWDERRELDIGPGSRILLALPAR